MRYEVETGSGRRTIEVQRAGERWRVAVNGRVMWVDLAAATERWSMLVRGGTSGADSAQSASADGTPWLAGTSHEVAIESSGNRSYLVHVDGRAVPVTLLGANSRRTRARGHGAADTGSVSIVAPMPGRIVKVLVKPGDTVAPRQALVVVEAMKMENELRSPRAGTVVEVRAREGAPVDANVLLVLLE